MAAHTCMRLKYITQVPPAPSAHVGKTISRERAFHRRLSRLCEAPALGDKPCICLLMSIYAQSVSQGGGGGVGEDQGGKVPVSQQTTCVPYKRGS